MDPTHPPENAADAGPSRWHALVSALASVQKILDRILALICIIAFVALVVIVSWQVFTREVLHHSAPWTEEAARQTFILLALLAIAYVFSERGHIAVTMFARKLPLGGQKLATIVIELIVIFFIILVFIQGGLHVAANAWNQNLSILPISVGQTYLMLPIVGILIIFYAINHIIQVLADAAPPFPVEDDEAEAV